MEQAIHKPLQSQSPFVTEKVLKQLIDRGLFNGPKFKRRQLEVMSELPPYSLKEETFAQTVFDILTEVDKPINRMELVLRAIGFYHSFRKVEIQDTETNRRLLAHKLHDDEVHGTPYGDFSTYIVYLISLDATVSWIQRLIDHVKAELQIEFESPSDHGERFLGELYNRLDEMC
jgi:hypothetical protein